MILKNSVPLDAVVTTNEYSKYVFELTTNDIVLNSDNEWVKIKSISQPYDVKSDLLNISGINTPQTLVLSKSFNTYSFNNKKTSSNLNLTKQEIELFVHLITNKTNIKYDDQITMFVSKYNSLALNAIKSVLDYLSIEYSFIQTTFVNKIIFNSKYFSTLYTTYTFQDLLGLVQHQDYFVYLFFTYTYKSLKVINLKDCIDFKLMFDTVSIDSEFYISIVDYYKLLTKNTVFDCNAPQTIEYTPVNTYSSVAFCDIELESGYLVFNNISMRGFK